jgi:hypothetical protein
MDQLDIEERPISRLPFSPKRPPEPQCLVVDSSHIAPNDIRSHEADTLCHEYCKRGALPISASSYCIHNKSYKRLGSQLFSPSPRSWFCSNVIKGKAGIPLKQGKDTLYESCFLFMASAVFLSAATWASPSAIFFLRAASFSASCFLT